MSCACLEGMDAKLAPHNAKVGTTFRLHDNTLSVVVLVATEKLDKAKRKALPYVAATFCPFCGTRWGDA